MSRYPRHVEVASHTLAEGGEARVSRLGWKYTFFRSAPAGSDWATAPTVEVGLTREQAFGMLADTIRDEVCDLD